MMRKPNMGRFIAALCLFCFLACVFCGCETVRGMGRDIKNADQWFREHAW